LKTYTPAELSKIIADHALYVKGDPAGFRAYLSGANLSGADLRSADLSGANLSGAYLSSAYLSGADLRGADLRSADLSGANLSGAYLSGAYLSSADLSGAYLRGADLRSADLSGANLSGAYLSSADLSGADLRGADLDKAVIARTLITPVGAFEAFKITREGIVLRLLIPASAKRFGGLIGRKCRASEAKVIGAIGSRKKRFTSSHDPGFTYIVGKTYKIKDFCNDPRIECAPGIHFFMTEIEAREY